MKIFYFQSKMIYLLSPLYFLIFSSGLCASELSRGGLVHDRGLTVEESVTELKRQIDSNYLHSFMVKNENKLCRIFMPTAFSADESLKSGESFKQSLELWLSTYEGLRGVFQFPNVLAGNNIEAGNFPTSKYEASSEGVETLFNQNIITSQNMKNRFGSDIIQFLTVEWRLGSYNEVIGLKIERTIPGSDLTETLIHCIKP